MNSTKIIIQFFNHAGVKRYGLNTVWLMSERVLRLVFGLFVGTWVARYLGAEQFGILSYSQSLVMLFATFATLGLDGVVIRQLVENGSEKSTLLGTSFVLRFIGGCLVFLSLLLISNFIYTNEIVFIITLGFLFQSFNVIDFYFQSRVLSRYVVIANIFSLVLSSLIKILLIHIKAPLVTFAWVIVFDSVSVLVLLIYFYHKNNLHILDWRFNLSKAHALLKESWPLIIAGMASMINMRMDQVMLGNMTTNTVVGNYAAAIRIAELWLVFPVVIGSSIYPAIISAKKVGDSFYRKRVMATIKYMALFAIPFALFVTIFSENIIKLLYGNEFHDSDIYLSMYIWTGLPYVIFFVLSQVCIIERITKISSYVTVFVLIFNVLLNYLLIPKYGGIGAVSATLIVSYVGQLILILSIQKKTKVFSKYLAIKSNA